MSEPNPPHRTKQETSAPARMTDQTADVGRRHRGWALTLVCLLWASGGAAAQAQEARGPSSEEVVKEAPSPVIDCPEGEALASGMPISSLFSTEASKGVRAHWCEHYDEYARTIRVGPYVELYPDGATRTEASFREGQLHGPLVIRHEDGRPWLRSHYIDGLETGPLEIFHPSGALWLETGLETGVLHGPLRTYFPDGSVESETRFDHGREQGIARSYYPAHTGGQLRSETRVEGDRMLGEPRLLDVAGRPAAADADSGASLPAAPAPIQPAERLAGD